jgi:triacylglycerol lipase
MGLFDAFDPGTANDFFNATRDVAFDPNDARYNRRNARWLAEFSRLMYVRDAGARRPFLPPGITEEVLQGTDRTEVAIFRASGFDVLAFRGTQLDSLNGFLTDVLTDTGLPIPLPWPPYAGRVHGSVGHELIRVWPQIETKLLDLPHPQPLFFTGHSLGGAMATLASAVSRKRIPRATYTFGAPRVGDAAFVASIQPVPLHRVENAHDPIPMVPRLLDWVPAGTLQMFKAKGVLPNIFTSKLLGRALDKAARTVGDFTEISLLDHDPAVYLRNV